MEGPFGASDGSPRAAEPATFVGLTDAFGVLRGKAVSGGPARDGLRLSDVVLGMDPTDGLVEGLPGDGRGRGLRDLHLRFDAPPVELPWRPGWRLQLAGARWPDGTPCAWCPRELLAIVLDRCRAAGLTIKAAFEYELELWRDGAPATSGQSYSFHELERIGDFVDDLRAGLAGAGVQVAAIHTEAGRGFVEVSVAPRTGVEAADTAVLVRLFARSIARNHGMRASFLAKRSADQEGLGGHVHLSLCDGAGKNAGAVADGAPFASPLAAATAGLVEHLPALSALLNPTINSYKRLDVQRFAPTSASWGHDDRTKAVRVLDVHSPDRARVELRRAGADADPYLVLAGAAAAMADGVERELPLPPDGSPARPAARSLERALDDWRRSADVLARLLDPSFVEFYAATRAWELRCWQGAVSDWEVARYDGA